MAEDKTCRLCGSDAGLILSHAIPASALRRTKSNGKNVQIENGRLNEKSQSDGKAPLLCADCDRDFLGDFFDRKGSELLNRARSSDQLLMERSSGIDVADMLAGWTLSILWRAHHLETPQYENYQLPDDLASDIKSKLLTQKMDTSKCQKWSKSAIISVYRLVDRFNKIDDHQAICAFPSLFRFPVNDGDLHCTSFRILGYEFRVVHCERKRFGIKGHSREVLRSGHRVFTRPHHFLDNPYYADQLSEFAFLGARRNTDDRS